MNDSVTWKQTLCLGHHILIYWATSRGRRGATSRAGIDSETMQGYPVIAPEIDSLDAVFVVSGTEVSPGRPALTAAHHATC